MKVMDTTAARLAHPAATASPAASLRFELAAAALAGWVLAGLYLDGWAHNNIPGLFETFFTPWHGVLYSGFLANGVYYFFHFARSLRAGYAFGRALPRGYGLSLAGVLIFAFGGGFDMTWHNVCGFEESLEALLSPAHLLLVLGAVLFCAGPLRAAWARGRAEAGWRALLPAWVSLFCLLGIFTFFTQYAHIFGEPDYLWGRSAGGFLVDAYGIFSVLTPAALLMSAALLSLRRWTLPPGFLALLIAGNSALMAWVSYGDTEQYPILLAAAVAGGLLADALLWALRPSAERLGALRAWAFAVPFLFFLLYFAALMSVEPIHWTIHMWLGVTVLAGVVGVLLSFLVFPPPEA